MAEFGPLLEITNLYRDMARANTQLVEELAIMVTNCARMELDNIPSRMVLDILENHTKRVEAINNKLVEIMK